jgi:chromosome segregation ATPase
MAPSLAQVLSSGPGSAGSVNLLVLAAGVLASLVAAVSVAKGRTVFKRRSALTPASGNNVSLEDSHYQEKMAKLTFMFDELKLEKESVVEQNYELRNQLAGLSGALYDLKQARVALEKETGALNRENEQLKAEIEKLTERSIDVPRKSEGPLDKKINKNIDKQRLAVAKKISKKEAAGRKPERVSRNKKK